jgi:hypothetical protein
MLSSTSELGATGRRNCGVKRRHCAMARLCSGCVSSLWQTPAGHRLLCPVSSALLTTLSLFQLCKGISAKEGVQNGAPTRKTCQLSGLNLGVHKATTGALFDKPQLFSASAEEKPPHSIHPSPIKLLSNHRNGVTESIGEESTGLVLCSFIIWGFCNSGK